MLKLKDFIAAGLFFVLAVIFTVFFLVVMMTASISSGGIILSPVVMGSIVFLLLLVEWAMTLRQLKLSCIFMLFHTLVFLGVWGLSYKYGLLDGYSVQIEPEGGVPWRSHLTIDVSDKEWYMFYLGYAVRLLLQGVSIFFGVSLRRNGQKLEADRIDFSLSHVPMALPAFLLWGMLGVHSCLLIPKPIEHHFLHGNSDVVLLDELEDVTGCDMTIYKPLNWLMCPKTGKTEVAEWDRMASMLITISIAAFLLLSFKRPSFVTEVISSVLLFYCLGYGLFCSSYVWLT